MENYNKIINYEENIFFLKLCLTNLSRVRTINLNEELFKGKIKQDMIFIFKTIQVLKSHLIKNEKLITKDDQIHSLIKLQILYNKTCNDLLIQNILQDSEFLNYIQKNKDDSSYLNDLISTNNQLNSKEDITTNEELNILFMEETDESDE